MNKKYQDFILAFALILLAIAFRTVLHIGPNIEFVTIASLGAGYFLSSKKLAILVPIIIMGISDAIIGNTSIFLFTWSAFLFAPVLGIVSKSSFMNNYLKSLPNLAKPMLVGLGGSTISVLVFFLWTNFGVVVTTTMYPDTISGLFNSYVNALPFLRNQLVGNMLFAPIVFTLVSLAKNLLSNLERKELFEIK